MLPKTTLADHYPEYASMNILEQVHVNHEHCSAGTDTKKRLYIRRATNNMWLLHCHHCGDSGVFKTHEPSPMVVPGKIDPSTRFSKAISFHDWNEFCEALDLRTSPTPIQSVWLDPVDDTTLNDHFSVFFNHTDNSIYLPYYADKSVEGSFGVAGYQVRHFDGDRKYTTCPFTSDSYASYWSGGARRNLQRVSIICEDLLSYYWCIHHGFSAICLLGTSPPDWTALRDDLVTNKIDRLILWLDDDTAGHKASIELVKNINLMLPVGMKFNLRIDRQPKHLTSEEMNAFRNSLTKSP